MQCERPSSARCGSTHGAANARVMGSSSAAASSPTARAPASAGSTGATQRTRAPAAETQYRAARSPAPCADTQPGDECQRLHNVTHSRRPQHAGPCELKRSTHLDSCGGPPSHAAVNVEPSRSLSSLPTTPPVPDCADDMPRAPPVRPPSPAAYAASYPAQHTEPSAEDDGNATARAAACAHRSRACRSQRAPCGSRAGSCRTCPPPPRRGGARWAPCPARRPARRTPARLSERAPACSATGNAGGVG